ncbi:MAG: hypothetical protein QM736_03875 [Vicinamibacterales bacterium]
MASTIDSLRRKGFGRLLVDGRAVSFDDVEPKAFARKPLLQVVVDRVQLGGDDERKRLTDSIETAYREGGGAAWVVELAHGDRRDQLHKFSERFECRECGIAYEDPQPRLFSFNNPFGACPTCHGFGNIVELDMDLVVPDPSKSIAQNAIEPWSKPHYRAQLAELKRAAKKHKLRLDVPWSELTDDERRFVIEGNDDFDGIRGFFRWLDKKKYKVHVRVFLSRYRGYLTCPDCGGSRLRREARVVKIAERTIRSGVGFHGARGAAVLRRSPAHAEGDGDCRQGAEGDQAAARVPRGCRARLPLAGSPVVHALRRRSAAHQPGHVARVGAGRHALRPRRTVDRPAFTRQPAAD